VSSQIAASLTLSFANPCETSSEKCAGRESVAMRRQYCKDQARFRCSIAKIVEKQQATVWVEITMDQSPDIVVLGDKDPPLGGSFGKENLIAGVRGSLANIDNVVAGIPHGAHSLRNDIGIGEKAHATWLRS